MNRLFDLYTNAPEYENDLPDLFGRARLYNSSNKDIFNPEISHSIHSAGLRPHYPGNKQFAVCISHDIDHLYLRQKLPRKFLNAGKGFLKGRLGQGFDHLSSIVREKVYKEYDLRKLIGINNGYDIRSTYYFLSLEEKDQDFNYHPSEIPDQLKAVVQSNGEIGLHGGHKAYNNLEKLLYEKELLEAAIGMPVIGYRNHYLRFELPTTLNNLESAGFQYDTTLGYADCIGFRNGMCYPFLPFDIVNKRFLDIVELPLIIMDATIFYYMRMTPDVAFRVCKQVIGEVMKCNGVLTLLWHNNFVSGEMGAFYIRLLDFLRSTDPWFATSADVVKWWKEENLLQQSQEIVNEIIKK